jgi:hypothetical protein
VQVRNVLEHFLSAFLEFLEFIFVVLKLRSIKKFLKILIESVIGRFKLVHSVRAPILLDIQWLEDFLSEFYEFL